MTLSASRESLHGCHLLAAQWRRAGELGRLSIGSMFRCRALRINRVMSGVVHGYFPRKAGSGRRQEATAAKRSPVRA